MPESWNQSNEKTKELRLEHWGSFKEVDVMAEPVRFANNRKTAMDCLIVITEKSPFRSRSGIIARLSKRSLGKIVSHAAVINSFCPEVHYLAAANIDKLFSNAIEPWEFELNPNKDNTGLKARRYLYAPLKYDGKIVIVKITVKEYADTDLQNKLYSIGTLNVDLKL